MSGRSTFARDVTLAVAPAVVGIVVQAVADEVRAWLDRRRAAEKRRAKRERRRWEKAS